MEQNQNLPALATQLAQLPDVIAANTSLADRAVATVRQQIEPLKAIDLATVDAATMEQHDQSLAGLQNRLKDSYTLMNDRRKPFTQRMDEIKALFTAEEKKIVEIGNEVKALRDGWQKEKGRRNQIALEEQQKEQERKQALIDCKTYFAKMIIDRFSTAAVDAIKRMHAKFYAQSIEGIDAYAAALQKWQPQLDNQTWEGFQSGIINPKPQLITNEQRDTLLREVAEEQRPKLALEWVTRMEQERNTLVELVPSRKMELERIAGDEQAAKEAAERIAQEQREREEQARQEAADKAAALEQAAEVDKMNSAFDVAAQAAPVVGIAKGTSVKKKYVAKSHKAWAAMLQSWVKNDMANMTLEELGKKLGFVKTACEGRLNKGEMIEAEGLTWEEDYSTRSSRTARKEEKAA
jgi:hypothetical protein